MITRPMKGEELEIENDEMLDSLNYPLLGTPKLDGIRSVKQGGRALSSSFKDIPNLYVQKKMKPLPEGLDGELIVNADSFNQVQSGIMSEDGEPDFQFYVFDYVSVSLTQPYQDRIEALKKLSLPSFCIKLIPTVLNNKEELIAYEKKCLDEGYEGIMVRSPDGPYKCGKATVNQGWLLKVKRFKDSEAVIIGFEEQQENTNEKTVNELGKSTRSKHKAGMVLKNTLGKFLVREVGETPWKGREFAIGTGEGLGIKLRQEVWDNKDKYLGKIVTYKYQEYGIKELPRLPIWKSFRDPRDMS
jgi:DNA ligase-1